MKSILLDLDGTLFDSREVLAAARDDAHELELLQAGGGRLFDGVLETLQALRARGVLLGIVTSSTRPCAEAIVQRHGLDRLVHVVFCADDAPGGGKAALVAASLKELQKPACMVGDRAADLEAARAHGLPAIGCLWGYGDAQELLAANRIASDWTELRAILEEWLEG